MAYQNSNGGYQPQNPAPRGQQGRQKKEILNKVEYTGIVRPLSKNDNDPIRFYPFPSGGGIIHFVLRVTEPNVDSNGQPRYNDQGQPMVITTPVSVDVRTNKNLSPEFLSSIVSGMKVHVVGRTRHTAYKDRHTNEDRFKEVCEAYVLDILAGPMQNAYGGTPAFGQAPMAAPVQNPAYGGYYPGYQPQPGYAQQPMYAPQPAYTPQGYPQQPYGQAQPGYQPQAPAQGYAPAPAQPYAAPQAAQPARPMNPGGYQQGQAQPRQATAQPQTPPPYYKPPQAPSYPDDDDLPMGDMPQGAPTIKDINI